MAVAPPLAASSLGSVTELLTGLVSSVEVPDTSVELCLDSRVPPEALEHLVMLVLSSEQKGKELRVKGDPGGRPARVPQPSLRPVLLALSPPLHGLAHGLPQPFLVVADVVMRQAQQLVHILLAVGHFCVVVWGVGR